MSGSFFFMGNSITDRTNRITLVKLVAQRLGIDRGGYVEFYLVNGNVVIRKGEKEYEPNKGRTGFYMGSSVVDRDNRTTIIKLVVQNLQIDSKSIVNYFLHDEEIVIKKATPKYDAHSKEIDFHALGEEDLVLILQTSDLFFRELQSYVESNNKGPTPFVMDEILAMICNTHLKDLLPEKQEFVLRSVMQIFHTVSGPEGMIYLDKVSANYLRTAGVKEENLAAAVKRTNELEEFMHRMRTTHLFSSEKSRVKKVLKDMNLKEDDITYSKTRVKPK